MSNEKHTPEPWAVGWQADKCVVETDEQYICFLATDENDTGEANAKFIVRACNAHADMAEALKASKIEHHIGDDPWESCHKTDDWYECHGKIRGTPRVCNCGADEHNARINAALAKAGVDNGQFGLGA